MCGIAGLLTLERPVDARLVAGVLRMLDAQVHRGPDDWGILLPEGAEQDPQVRSLLGAFDQTHIRTYPGPGRAPAIVLGCRRLSIIDLSPRGRMPLGSADGRVWITYNGEIYNFRELRAELEHSGYAFYSNTDTEVILYGYEEWGEEVVNHLRGMFAFAVLDARVPDQLKLFLARDRFGIKPLYWTHRNRLFQFGSEVKALTAGGLLPNEAETRALFGFLIYGSVPSPFTTVKGVYSLPAAQRMTVTEETTDYPNPSPYWSLPQAGSLAMDAQDAVAETRRLLEESVRMQLVSDVPLGVFLSGGLDSSTITALASRNLSNPLTTLSVTFDEPEFTEAEYAAEVAERFGCRHVEVRLRAQDFAEETPRILAAMDQPSVDGVNTYFIARAARELGLTVVLSGLGGDEVFWGYQGFRTAPRLAQWASLPGGGLGASIIAALGRIFRNDLLEKFEFLGRSNHLGAYLTMRGLFSPSRAADLLGSRRPRIVIEDPVNRPLRPPDYAVLEISAYLQNQLLRDTDVMSMAHSVEVRVPFLDHRLAEMVCGLPEKYKLCSTLNKPLLAKAMADDLPADILRRKKMGFTFPFDVWIRERAEELKAKSLEQATLEREEVERIWDRLKAGQLHWSRAWATTVAGRLARNGIKQPGRGMAQELRVGQPRILVYRTGQLGDTVCAIPAIRAIREWIGPCDLVLLTDYHPGREYPVAANILSEFAVIDDTILYDPKSIFSLAGALALRKEIRRRRVKTMFYLGQSYRSNVSRMRDLLFFRWCGIKGVYGLSLGASPCANGAWQEVDRLLGVLRRSGLQVPSRGSFNLSIPTAVRARVDDLWRSLGLEREMVVAVSAGSKMPAKRWGEDRYEELGLRLTSGEHVRLVVLGGPEDHALAERLCQAWNGKGVSLAGQTSYVESAEVLRRCRLYVGNDNGAMHLAAAVGTPCVAIFSARDAPGAWYPYGERHTVFRKDVECQGCMLVECVEQKMKCIRSVSVDEVFAACLRHLSEVAGMRVGS